MGSKAEEFQEVTGGQEKGMDSFEAFCVFHLK